MRNGLCHFLLVIYSKLGSIFRRFQDTATYSYFLLKIAAKPLQMKT